MSSKSPAAIPDQPGLTQRPRDWGTALAASAGRVGLGLLFAPFVVQALPGEVAARVFQLLFLQGGLIALLSASAYARAAQLASGSQPIWPAVRSFVRFLTLGTCVAIAAGIGLVPLPHMPEPARWGVLVVLVVGAACSALVGFLQGVTVVTTGGLAAFLPSVMVSLLSIAGLIVLWRPQSMLAVVALWGVPQILNAAVLLAVVPSARQVFRRVGAPAHPERSMFAATGVVNVASVGVSYAFRERWASAQSGNQAELGFLVVRLSELLFQVLYMGAASVPRRLNEVAENCLSTLRGRLVLLAIGLAGGALAVTPLVVSDSGTFDRFVLAEAAAAPARIITMLSWLYLLGRRTTGAYQTAVLGGIALAFAAMAIPPVQTSPYGLQAFHVANLASALVVLLSDGARTESSTTPRRGPSRTHS